MTAEELRLEAEIRAGRSTALLKDARSMVAEAPLRERRWALLARALYQSGRQSDSLDVIGRARRMLRDELGLDPGPELVALEQAILRQDPDLAATDTQPTSSLCPYRGLLSYETEDADSFFGRDAEVGGCLKLLRERGTLALVGPSGSGKSSLVRAGIVAVLRDEGRKVIVTTPGPRPLDSLAELPQRGPSPVLVVDQAEEAFTLCANAEERAAYFAALAGHAGELIVALRADHLGDLAAYPAFARIIERGLHLLTAMDEHNLRAAVEEPARQAGLRLEAGLSDLLVREVAGEPGALPLLSHVLRQTWENREGRTLTVDGYRRSGGVRNALAQSAETLYQGLDEPQRGQIRALFLRLVMPSTDGDPVRARVPRSKVALDSEHERLIEALIAARLVTTDNTEIQIAHEALAREWPRLQDWLAQDVEGQQIFRHLANAAESWEQMGRPDSELYRGSRLAAAVEWADRSGSELTTAERGFLADSQASAKEEMRQTQLRLRAKVRSNRRLRAALVAALLLLSSAVVAGSLAIRAANRAEREKTVADAATLGADARRLAAVSLTSPDLATSALLAAASYRLQDTADARGALLSVLEHGRSALWRLGTNGNATGVWAAPDGSRLYVSTESGVEVIDPVRRKVVASYPPPENIDHIVALTGGSTRMVRLGYRIKPNGDQLRRMSIADARSGKLLYYLRGADLSIAYDAPSLAPDGRWLAAGAASDGLQPGDALAVYDTTRDRSRPPRTLAFPTGKVVQIAASNRVVFAQTGDGTVYLVDPATMQVTAHARRHDLPNRDEANLSTGGAQLVQPPSPTLTPNGRTLGYLNPADRSTPLLLNTARLEGAPMRLPTQPAPVTAMQFSPDGTELAVGSFLGAVNVYSVRDGSLQFALAGHSGWVVGAAWANTPDGPQLYTAGLDSQVVSWNVAQTSQLISYRGPTLPQDQLAVLGGDHVLGDWVLSPTSPASERQLFDLDLASGTVHRWQARVGDLFTEAMIVLDETADGSLGLVTIQKFGTERRSSRSRWQLWDLRRRRLLTTIYPLPSADQNHYLAASISRDGTAAAVASGRDRIAVLSLPSGDVQRVFTVPVDHPAPGPYDRQVLQPYAFTPAGQLLVWIRDWGGEGPADNRIGLVDVQTGRSLVQTSVGAEQPNAEAWSSDGSMLAIGAKDGGLRLYDAHTLRLLRTAPNAHAGYVSALSFSPDGRTILTSGTDAAMQFWDVATMAPEGPRLTVTHGSTNWLAYYLADGDVAGLAPAGKAQGDAVSRPFHFPGRVSEWLDATCTLAGSDITRAQWAQYVGDQPYRHVCRA
jgi:WD40 repeat protein